MYDSLRGVLRMDESTWRARYPIALQLAELQAAAEGVPSWERTLSHTPSGRKLVQSIDRLHQHRGRLVWLKEEGFTEQGVLQVLNSSEGMFKELYPDYPGDAEMHRMLGSELDVGEGDDDGAALDAGAE